MPASKKKKKIVDDLMAERLKLKAESPTVSPEVREAVNHYDLMAEMLKEEGVEQTFSVASSSNWAMEVANQRVGIPTVNFKQEQAATFAADAWGRITRRPGVAIIGTNTALCNGTSGAAQGYAAAAPMVIILSDGFRRQDRNGGGQASVENQYRGITKWARLVGDPGMFLNQLKRAFRSVVTHPTGPVALAWATDVLGDPTLEREEGTMSRMRAYQFYTPSFWSPDSLPRTQADPVLVEKALRWLLEAERPAMIVGHVIHQDDAEEELREFVHLLGIPCLARRIARGAISEYDPLNPGGRARGAVLRGSDRALVMGLRVGSLEGEGHPLLFGGLLGTQSFWGANTRYIQAQPCVEYINLVLATEHQLIGNTKMMLRQFIDCARDIGIKGPLKRWAKWRQFVVDTKTDYERRMIERTEAMKGKLPLHPDLVGRLATEFLHDEYQDDYIAIIDGWVASSSFNDLSKVIHCGQVLDSAEPNGMGHAFGMSIAAGLATKRDKPIFAVVGDGGLGADAMDIETAVKWNIPAIYLHFHENDNQIVAGGWNPLLREVSDPAANRLPESWGTLPSIRYDEMFKVFGCHTEFVEGDEQLKPVLKRAFDFALREKKPAFIEVLIDPDALQKLWLIRAALRSRWVKWDQLSERGQQMVLEYGLVSPSFLPTVDPTWRDAILAARKK
ncbi:MAG: thiamine pyrophosphate-binding protein [Chloroflexi bacterium]|nr:thiamine pyrophosphate-binding protein [Chloroflexota bacterium]